MSDYNFNTHKHNFSVWTAARSVNRGFTSTINIESAINTSGLRSFAENIRPITPELFKEFHLDTCQKIKTSFLKIKTKCSYGQAAKIIAIYLKTSVIIGSACKDSRCYMIHPPIDRILLKSLKRFPAAKTINWTQLTEIKYWKLMTDIQDIYKDLDWRLEKDWGAGRG